MLKYLIILLDDTSISYCHYSNEKNERNLIALEDLNTGILFAMKENLMIQFVYPDYELPQEYKEAIHSIDHSKIVPFGSKEQGDVVVFNKYDDFEKCIFNKNISYVLRLNKITLFKHIEHIKASLEKLTRLNIVITDIQTFKDNDFNNYTECLKTLSKEIEKLYISGKNPQLNLLTDRMMLEKMNNCNAGWENITLAPNGNFYICPAFYQADSRIPIDDKTPYIGNLKNGLEIKNPQLYKLSHAPICRNCDSYQCKRCVWLNRKTTYEINTPSYEQCVIAHIERNTSRDLLINIQKSRTFIPYKEIKEINYLDPFSIRNDW